MTERWKQIPYWQGYEASDSGNIRRLSDGKILRQYQQKSGYMYVWLNRGNGNTSVPVHRLVCTAFHGEKGYIEGLYVDHINTDRSCNRAENLHWVTQMENMHNPITMDRRKRL